MILITMSRTIAENCASLMDDVTATAAAAIQRGCVCGGRPGSLINFGVIWADRTAS